MCRLDDILVHIKQAMSYFATIVYRWTINMAIRTAEKMFYNETPFDSEDLVEVIFGQSCSILPACLSVYGKNISIDHYFESTQNKGWYLTCIFHY